MVLSFLIKGFSLILAFVKIPIFLSYLDVDKYGVWLTISSIVLWVSHFDFGIGHGLRNKFSIALAQEDRSKGRYLVSCAYIYLSLIFTGVMLVGLPSIWFADWNTILNSQIISSDELRASVAIVFVIFIVRFIAGLIMSVLRADQRPALADSYSPIASVISLVAVYFLSFSSDNSLFKACIAIALPDTAILILANVYFFRGRYKDFAPSFRFLKKEYFKEIFSLGLKFFVIQLAGIITMSTSNLIIAQTISPAEVTVFNIAKQYYAMPFMYFAIILLPYWSAITDAYTRDDFEWIKSSMRKLLLMGLVFIAGLFILFVFENWAIELWVGSGIQVSTPLALALIVFNCFMILFSPLTHFVNGVGKLRLSLIVSIAKAALFLPAAFYGAEHYGSVGLIVAMIIVISIPSSIVEWSQYRKIIERRATGIWNK
ncbi:MAG: lipopolysaccharide biosynthesis protein [Flavobacteriales bacterium]